MTKAETARHLGYGDDIAAMDLEHDPLHGALTHFLGVPSYSLKDARGETLTPEQRELAQIEEEAVLAAQRLRQMHRVMDMPKIAREQVASERNPHLGTQGSQACFTHSQRPIVDTEKGQDA